MIAACDCASGSFDIGPAELLANCTLDGRAHERATTSGPAQLIDLRNDLIVELYVHSHVQNLAHNTLRAFGGKLVE